MKREPQSAEKEVGGVGGVLLLLAYPRCVHRNTSERQAEGLDPANTPYGVSKTEVADHATGGVSVGRSRYGG